MGYIKVVKNKSYYKKYQVKMRRRRQCKTDYRLRSRLIKQDLRKYNTPKWRFVVRITNKDVIAQIVTSKMIGDKVMCAAYSHELKRYGLKVGLTNYAACYATGLLCARRLLNKLKLDKFYPGKKKLDGDRFKSDFRNVKWKPGAKIFRPFKCYLDVGLARCTTGARIFSVMKGAVDGGLDIPHSVKRFPGYPSPKKLKEMGADAKARYDPAQHRSKIFGEHVSKYMKSLQEENPDKYQRQFSVYIKEGIGPDDMEDLYAKVHREIRKDPAPKPKAEKRDWKKMDVRRKPARLTAEDRKANILKKISAARPVDADGDVAMV